MSVLDQIEESVNEWPNMIDPCGECKHDVVHRRWTVCGECCYYYPSKFEHKAKGDEDEQTANLSGDDDQL